MLLKENDRPAREPIPQGTYHAVCFSVIDLGTQKVEYQGNVSLKRQLYVTWEIPSERITIMIDDEEKEVPRIIGKKYTASLNPRANLRKVAESLRLMKNGTFDPEDLICVNSMLSIGNFTKDNGDEGHYISGISLLMNGIAKIEPESDTTYFSWDDSDRMPIDLPDWLTDILKESDEYKLKMGANATPAIESDPFG